MFDHQVEHGLGLPLKNIWKRKQICTIMSIWRNKSFTLWITVAKLQQQWLNYVVLQEAVFVPLCRINSSLFYPSHIHTHRLSWNERNVSVKCKAPIWRMSLRVLCQLPFEWLVSLWALSKQTFIKQVISEYGASLLSTLAQYGQREYIYERKKFKG